ncbi:hypothetical protein TRFO_38588 [Tritrichomonas foetus]|uniref:Ubiquitin-like domain-containing protein n=1 Tax=Tritrichomonas foetus TaxID=1144522 RepID=A0A1J4J7Z5_9EUKA|nr:hypothetical protein TRFO_38588 [Tritrichomonas foetus]|eukprot:OHS95318.1 hypothetical protein TRFO_38588 [Tritrichomonas foetus]
MRSKKSNSHKIDSESFHIQPSMVKIEVKSLKGMTIPLEVSIDAAARTLKNLLFKRTGVFPADMKLIFRGRVIRDDETVGEAGIHNGNTIYLTTIRTKDSNNKIEDKFTALNDGIKSQNNKETIEFNTNPINAFNGLNPFRNSNNNQSNFFNSNDANSSSGIFQSGFTSYNAINGVCQNIRNNSPINRSNDSNNYLNKNFKTNSCNLNGNYSNESPENILAQDAELLVEARILAEYEREEFIEENLALLTNPDAFVEGNRLADIAFNNIESVQGGFIELVRNYREMEEFMDEEISPALSGQIDPQFNNMNDSTVIPKQANEPSNEPMPFIFFADSEDADAFEEYERLGEDSNDFKCHHLLWSDLH